MKTIPLLAGLFATLVPAFGDLPPEAARAILTANQEALAIVSGVLKAEVMVNGARRGEERENRVQVSGFILDPSGLVLVSRYHINPVGVMSPKPVRIEREGQSMEVQMKTRLENLRIRLRDGREFNGRVTLDDPDLALMLIAPEFPADSPKPAPFKFVSLDDIVEPGAFTSYLIVDGGEASFQSDVVLEAGVISGVIPRKRPLYFQDLGRHWMFIGAPFFDLGGKLLGMGLMHVTPPTDPASGSWDSVPVAAIVPASQIREMVDRALGKETPAKPVPPASTEQLGALSAEKAAAILKASGEGVATIEGTLKYTCGRCAEEHEEQVDATGTLLDASGLLVIGNDGDSSGNKYIKQDLRCHLADGADIPYRIVLHDDDLLLTVLAPTEPLPSSSTLKPLAVRPEVLGKQLDDVVTLGRLGKEDRYSSSAAVGRIAACVRLPRAFYLVNSLPPSVSSEGLAVLNAEGALLGVTAPDPKAVDPEDENEDPNSNAGPVRTGRIRIVPTAALTELLDHARKAMTTAAKP